MLRPLILLFINFYYVDLLALNVLLAGATFLWEFYLGGAVWWHFLIQLPVAVLISTLGRTRQWRVWGYGTQPHRAFVLWPRYKEKNDDWTRPLLVVFLLSLCTLGYNQRIHHPSLPLSDLFPIGNARTLVILSVVSFFLESIGYYLEQPSCMDWALFGAHSLCRFIVVAICAFDMAVFSRAWETVLTGTGILLGVFILWRLFNWLFEGVGK